MPGDKWIFDATVTHCFDDMLQRSIPLYTEMRKLITSLGMCVVHPGDAIVDLGCSRGEALAPFVQKYGAFCTYYGVEVSEPMLEAARARFANLTPFDTYGDQLNPPRVHIQALDLRTAYPDVCAQLTMAVLTLMFVPIERRAFVINNVFTHTKPGGVFLVVEKVLGASEFADSLQVALY